MSIKTSGTSEPLHIAVAAIVDEHNQILISRRPDHVHQGGLWEFPGGKVEQGETVLQALSRELHEELGVVPVNARPLIRVCHSYPELSVDLDVWKVEGIQGLTRGCEGQQIEWVSLKELHNRPFPAANRSIIRALQLPSRYLITPEPDSVGPDFTDAFKCALTNGIRLIQLRANRLSERQYRLLATEALALCRDHNARLLLNRLPETVLDVGADGVHLPAGRLLDHDARPLGPDYWVAASCHNQKEIDHAERIGVDFIMVSPVCSTLSHPKATPLGWNGFAALCGLATVPVYALGGLTDADMVKAYQHGAQGIAAIRGLWPEQIF